VPIIKQRNNETETVQVYIIYQNGPTKAAAAAAPAPATAPAPAPAPALATASATASASASATASSGYVTIPGLTLLECMLDLLLSPLQR
jgi:hypothetical protein